LELLLIAIPNFTKKHFEINTPTIIVLILFKAFVISQNFVEILAARFPSQAI
jgi:hypothetical protein